MLKYIIIAEATGEEVAFFCLAPTKHLELALSQQAYKGGRKVVAAGFVEFVYVVPKGAGPEASAQLTARTYGWSESLDVRPRAVDAQFLTVFARQTAECAAAAIASIA